MKTINWQSTWQAVSQDAYARAELSLLVFNGLTFHQIQTLDRAHIDLERRWLTTADGSTYPLVTYVADALAALPESDSHPFADSRLASFYADLMLLEAEAHRRLAGAIWYTSEEGQLLLDTTGATDVPILPLRFTFPFSITERLQPGEDSDVAVRSREVLQAAADWLFNESFAPQASPAARVLKSLRQGSTIFLVASMGVNVINLAHNVLMGRLLTPADYGQLTFIITLQLLIGLLPTAVQTVVARFSARYSAQKDMTLLAALRVNASRIGKRLGIAAALIILLLSPLLLSLFQLNDFWLLLPVIIAVPFFVAMGTDRGFLQGLSGFWWLSAAYLSEGIIRLAVGVILGFALLAVGRSLEGAVWGVAQAMVITWFISWVAARHIDLSPADSTAETVQEASVAWRRLGGMTLLALVGQALITNSDFVLVKNFFSPADAGLYAAVSVLARIVYFGALPFTIVMVPLIARRQALNEPLRIVFVVLLGGGVVVCGGLIFGSLLFAPHVLRLLYGEPYLPAAGLLAPYALAASLYTLTNLAITYQIAMGNGGETWMPILAGGAQIVGILLFHQTLMQVILVQVVLMALLFAVVLWRVLRAMIAPAPPEVQAASAPA